MKENGKMERGKVKVWYAIWISNLGKSWVDKDIYDGEWKNGLKNGYGKFVPK